MTTAVQLPDAAPEERSRATWPADLGMAAGVLAGAVLFVATAYAQPYNQNELQQIAPYGSNRIHEIVNGTRQPPLGALLGGIIQHLVGTGQLVQRAVPVLSGIGTLALMALLFRRLRLGWAGTFGIWLMATAPLMMRYSAYTRPYALPVFCMMLLVYAAVRWLDGGRLSWLLLALVGAVALPLSRVPEPVLYLVTTVVTLFVLTWRGRWSWGRCLPVVVICLVALLGVGYPMYRDLAAQASSHHLYNPSPSAVADRFPAGVHEIVTFLIPFLGSLFPWWPLTLLTVLLALVVPQSRRKLAQWWFVWPLLAAPVGFALAYHFLNHHSFDVRPYRPRMAYFFVPPYVLFAAALASAAVEGRRLRTWARAALAVLLAATLVGQLPAAARTLTEKEAIDFGQAAHVLTHDLPSDAVVLFDTASPVGRWRQPFLGTPRYMGKRPYVATVSKLKTVRALPDRPAPVFILLMDSRCGYTVVCDAPPARWQHPLRGWHVLKRFDRFALYAPDTPARGRRGAIRALTQLGEALGPKYGYRDTFAAAVLWRQAGQPDRGRALVQRMYDHTPPALLPKVRKRAPGWI